MRLVEVKAKKCRRSIAAHEYTHAVTSFGPKLVYFGESGAVNEFFSDFFAAMIDRPVNGTTDWRIGEGWRAGTEDEWAMILGGHQMSNVETRITKQ